MDNLYLNTTKYADYFAIINKNTGNEICKISKSVNTVDSILKQYPELEIEDETNGDDKNDIFYKDGKWYDKYGKEYESDSEYYDRQD